LYDFSIDLHHPLLDESLSDPPRAYAHARESLADPLGFLKLGDVADIDELVERCLLRGRLVLELALLQLPLLHVLGHEVLVETIEILQVALVLGHCYLFSNWVSCSNL
jgi:hypothetical protein